MHFKKLFSAILCIAFLFTLCGCATQNIIDNKKPVIAVSLGVQKTFVEKVCDDRFEIVVMIPSGASPETYEATQKQLALLESAKLYFAIGVPAEERILNSLNRDTVLCKLNESVADIYPELTDSDESGRDPHIWLSPKRVIVMIEEIAKVLSETLPENSEIYTQNAQKYIAELKQLDNDINYIFKDKLIRRFLVFHPSFGYFADDYGLTMLALEEHGKEVNAQRIAEMSDIAKKYNIDTVFYQAESSERQAQAFAEAINGKTVCLEPLAENYIDNIKSMAKKIYEATN